MPTHLSKFLCDRMFEGSRHAASDAATEHFDKRFPNSMSGVIASDPQGGIRVGECASCKMTLRWSVKTAK